MVLDLFVSFLPSTRTTRLACHFGTSRWGTLILFFKGACNIRNHVEEW